MTRIHGYGPSIVVLLTTVVVLFAGPAAVKRLTFARTEAQILQASRRLEDNTILEQLNRAYRDIAIFVEPSVVHISTEVVVDARSGRRGRRASSGSGWVFDADGHIVTNHHVIEGATRIQVQLHTGDIREAEVVGADPSTDVAVLRIPSGQLHPATRRTDSDGMVDQGDMVFAFGSPFDFRFSMSSGVVSGKGRSVGVIRDERGRPFGYENFIQVDAAINPGNSGGPLTDFRGHVIGMNTAIATGRGSGLEEGQFAGIGLAIPLEMIEPVVEQLISGGEVMKGYLGLSVVDREYFVADDLSTVDFPLRGGLFVATIEPDHPARAAGLRAGDVITRVGGRDVTTLEQYLDVVSAADPDLPLELTIWRGQAVGDRGRSMSLQVSALAARGVRGMTLLQMQDSIGQLFSEMGFTGHGVRVARLESDGPARAAGVRRGDIITHVNDTPIGTVQQLRSVISSMLPGETAQLRVWRYDDDAGEGRDVEIPVELTRLSRGIASNDFGTPPDPEQLLDDLGLELRTSSRALADRMSIPFHRGVVVSAIRPGAPADEHGLVVGATIVEIAERPVESVEELMAQWTRGDVRQGVRLTVILPDGNVIRPVVGLE